MNRQRRNAKLTRMQTSKRRKPPTQQKQEVSLLGKALRALGATAGGALGTFVGAPMSGAAAGQGLGASISKWLGSGDYTVTKNSIVTSARASSSVPMMHNTNQSVVVRHKDYLGQIVSSQAFAIQQVLPINPGRLETFPWLCNIARRFQEYTIKGLVFHYVPTSGSISTTQALGSVILQTTYRSTDASPRSKTEMLNEFWACETVPFEPLAHPIECDPKENPFNVQYVRSGEIAAGESKLSYDLGTTYVATSGQSTDGTVLGDLYVTYEVELRKPIIASNVTNSALVAGRGWTGTITTAALFNGTLAINDGALNVTFATNTLTMPVGTIGTFYISLDLHSTAGFSGACSTQATPTMTNCLLAPYFTDPSTGLANFGQSTAVGSNGISDLYVHICVVKTSADQVATIVFPSYTIPTGVINWIGARVINVENTS